MIAKCCKCGDDFTLDKETEDLLGDGWIDRFNLVCDDCFSMSEEYGE